MIWTDRTFPLALAVRPVGAELSPTWSNGYLMGAIAGTTSTDADLTVVLEVATEFHL